VLHADEKWHDFEDIETGFNMLDPIKATIITPGLNVDGYFDDTGIPAAIVSKYLSEHGIIIEKTGLYSFFIMFTIGITKGRWNSMVTELQQFKDDYDQNLPLWRVMPEFIKKFPKYERVGLKDLCQQIHEMYKEKNVAKITSKMYLSDIQTAILPSEAWDKMTHKQISRITIDELDNQITAILITPYPPGIPLMVPGERFNETIIHYLKFVRAFNNQFPGFESDVHGLLKQEVDGVEGYYVDVIAE